MKISLKALRDFQPLEKVVIHSLDCALYQVSVMLNGKEHYVTNDKGALLRSRAILEMQAHFKDFAMQRMVLRQVSAYDEMVGQPQRPGDNALEVPLTTEQHLI